MLRLFSSLKCLILRPRNFMRRRFKLPLVKFIHDTVSLYKARTKTGVDNVRQVLFRGSIIALITALLVWLSIFMYIAFYYAYVPAITHERPVHLKFKACETGSHKGVCSYPTAHIQLTERQRLLMLGQPYKIHLELEMPESPTNREVGMFMVCADFQGVDGKYLASSCRSTMLHYKGFLLDIIYKIVFSPFFLFGNSEEKQTLHIELFAEYEEHESQPVTDIFVEIQTTHVEIYSARFLINARFTGLRFLMYNWPVFSAAIGITSNLFFIALVCMLSWYQIINSEDYISLMEGRAVAKLVDFSGFESTGSSGTSVDEEMSLLDDVRPDKKNLRFRKGLSGSGEIVEEIHGGTSDC